MHFCFSGHECLSDRSIWKRYPKSDATPWLEKPSTSRAFHPSPSWHKILLVGWKCSLSHCCGMESEWKRCSLPLSIEKTLSVCVWIQLNHAWNPHKTIAEVCVQIMEPFFLHYFQCVVTKSPSTVLLIWAHGWGCYFTGNMISGPYFIKVKIFLKLGFKMNWSSYVLANSLNFEFLSTLKAYSLMLNRGRSQNFQILIFLHIFVALL